MFTAETPAKLLCCAVIGLALGSVNPAFLLARRKGYDARRDGSGNAGASNAFILAGKAAFFIAAIVDILKAYAACRICRGLFPTLGIAEQVGGVACILGHMFSPLLGFHGGKGLSCLGGTILSWDWRWFLILLGAAILLALVTRYICFVAPTVSVAFPALYFRQTGRAAAAAILLTAAVPIFLKHMENFSRIRQGTEARISYLWNKDAERKRLGR